MVVRTESNLVRTESNLVPTTGSGSDKLAEMATVAKSRLQQTLRRIGNPLRMWSLRLGIPSPPYTRRNAIIVETVGRNSGRRRRVPLGFLEEDGTLLVVAEDGTASAWVGNALAAEGRVRVHHHGSWKGGTLAVRDEDVEPYLQRMNRAHAAFVRIESSGPRLVEITLD